jgi:hypothetical protein
VRDPAGPGDAGRRPFDTSPRLQLVSAGVHHTNTETERPNSILPRRCVACSGRCLARACCRRSVSQPAGSALSLWGSRRACAPELRDWNAQATGHEPAPSPSTKPCQCRCPHTAPRSCPPCLHPVCRRAVWAGHRKQGGALTCSQQQSRVPEGGPASCFRSGSMAPIDRRHHPDRPAPFSSLTGGGSRHELFQGIARAGSLS